MAGGQATRLGNIDKGLARYKNKPLIEYVSSALSTQVSDIVISANRNIAEYHRYADIVVDDGNQNFEGPLKGLSVALPYCENENVIVCSCDVPFLPENFISLFDESSKVDVQIVSIQQRKQLCFLMQRSLQKNLNEYLKSGGKRVMQWIESNVHKTIEYSGDAKHFKNFNHPNDFLN